MLSNNKIDGPIPTEIGQLTKLGQLRVPPARPTPDAPRDRPSGRRWIGNNNKITGTFPSALCDVQTCKVKSGNNLVAPCGWTNCCDLDEAATCSNCWTDCGEKSGPCTNCGAGGKCCRSGQGYRNGGCDGHEGIADKHTCVAMPTTSFNCWDPCGEASGPCAYCGVGGMCCRRGEDYKQGGCDGKTGVDSYHTCVLAGSDSSSSKSKTGASLTIIVPVVVAAVLLVAAALFLVHKHAVAARQPHRDASMPNVGDGDEAEVEA